MKYFINPDYLLPVSEHVWHRCALEFTVPRGHGILDYDFQIGAYGGQSGWIELRKPLFIPAAWTAILTLEGDNLLTLKVSSMDGSEIHTLPLDPGQARQKVTLRLKSRLKHYYAEIMTKAGEHIRRPL